VSEEPDTTRPGADPRRLPDTLLDGRVRTHGDAPTPDGSTRQTADSPDPPVTARRVTGVLMELTEAVAATRPRDAAERLACETLVGSDLYRSAWLAVRSPSDGLAARASAGPVDPIDAVPTGDDAADTESPWTTAIRTGRPRVVDARGPSCRTWPGRDLTSGVVAAAPVERGTVDSVLVVHTERSNGVGELERAGLRTLGTTLGLRVEAARSRALFFADGAVAVSLRVSDPDSLLVRTARAHDCRLSLVSYATTGDGWLLRCDLTGADPAAVVETVADLPAVERCQTVLRRSDGGRLEVESADVPLLCRTAELGASVESAVAEDGVCRVTVDQPPTAAVCETVAGLRTAFPDLDFVSVRETDRDPSQPGVDGDLADLTDRQREALTVAYDAGYFEWPRDNTAEEIAPELGITSSTLHWHLREAQSRVFSTLLDGSTPHSG